MPSSYTSRLGAEKPAAGEQVGTWGGTVNDNMDILDKAICGHHSITLGSAGSSGSPNDFDIVDGDTSDSTSPGQNRFINFTDGGDLGADVYVRLTPNDAEKIGWIQNSLSGSRDLYVFQGTYSASNDYVIPAGYRALLRFDGGGAGAVVTNVNDGVMIGTSGLDFSDNTGTAATGAATVNELLNHFEVGTWQPSMWDTSFSDGEGQTYTTRQGKFVRIGNVVWIQGRLQMNDPGTLTTSSAAYIGNLPYTASSQDTAALAVSNASGNGIGVAGYNIDGFVEGGTNRIRLKVWDDTSGQSNLTIAEFGSVSGAISFSGFYMV